MISHFPPETIRSLLSWQTLVTSAAQWAAVNTHWGVMSVPPQKCQGWFLTMDWILTCHRYAHCTAFRPWTIRVLRPLRKGPPITPHCFKSLESLRFFSLEAVRFRVHRYKTKKTGNLRKATMAPMPPTVPSLPEFSEPLRWRWFARGPQSATFELCPLEQKSMISSEVKISWNSSPCQRSFLSVFSLQGPSGYRDTGIPFLRHEITPKNSPTATTWWVALCRLEVYGWDMSCNFDPRRRLGNKCKQQLAEQEPFLKQQPGRQMERIVGEASTEPFLEQQPFAPKKTNVANSLGNTPHNLCHLLQRTDLHHGWRPQS